jgi:predicted MFS family arabinose efflux permease
MSAGAPAVGSPTAPATRLWTRDFVFILLAVIGLFFCQFLLTPVAPAFIARTADNVAFAGYTTATFYLFTVLAELASARLIQLYNKKQLFLIALSIMAAGCFAFVLAGASIPLLLAAQGLRGVGFGMACVMATTLVASNAPHGREGEAMGYYGLMSAVPSFTGGPIGLSLFGAFGHVPVFVLAGSITVVAVIVTTQAVRGPEPQRNSATAFGELAGRRRAILLPVLAWGLFCMTFGSIYSLGALALPSAGIASAVSFFFFMGISRAVIRFATSRQVDNGDPKLIMVAGFGVAAIGLLVLSLGRGTDLAVLAAIIYGGAFGAIQNVALVGLLRQVDRKDYGTVSAAYNLAYDTGNGVGGLTLGWVSAAAGFTTAFWILAALPAISFVMMTFTHWRRASTESS